MPVTSTFDWRSRSRETTASNSLTVVASRQTCRNQSLSILTISGPEEIDLRVRPMPGAEIADRDPQTVSAHLVGKMRKQRAVRRGLLAEGADDKTRIEPDFGKLAAYQTDTVDQRLRAAALGADDEFEPIEADVAMVAQWQAPIPCARRNRGHPG